MPWFLIHWQLQLLFLSHSLQCLLFEESKKSWNVGRFLARGSHFLSTGLHLQYRFPLNLLKIEHAYIFFHLYGSIILNPQLQTLCLNKNILEIHQHWTSKDKHSVEGRLGKGKLKGVVKKIKSLQTSGDDWVPKITRIFNEHSQGSY